MDNFIIGQHGVFNEVKYKRDFRKEFWGIEVCLLNSDKEIDKLLKYKKDDDYSIGIHFPMRSGQ